jgi:hypothetical protein
MPLKVAEIVEVNFGYHFEGVADILGCSGKDFNNVAPLVLAIHPLRWGQARI